jgi:polar amino acid transport system substrate-binding protein
MKLFTILFITYVTFNSHLSIARNLEVGWELWFPYQYRNKAQTLVGLDIEVFKAIINQAGYRANYVELPWRRHLRYVKSGEIDIAFGASFTKERAEYAYFTEPYREEVVRLFVPVDSKIQLQKLADLKKTHYIIGIESGYYYGDEFEQLLKEPDFKKNIKDVLDIEENISLLLDGKIDGLLADPKTIAVFIKRYRIENELIEYPLPIYQTSIHIMLSKKTLDKTALQRFNNAIKTLKKDGSIANILQKTVSND